MLGLSIFGLFEEGLHDVFGGGHTNPSPFQMNGFEIGAGSTFKPEQGIGISGFKPQEFAF